MHIASAPHPDVPDVQVRPPVVHMPLLWEYKRIVQQASDPPLEEATLNSLGQEGWELTSAVTHAGVTHFYFKRIAG